MSSLNISASLTEPGTARGEASLLAVGLAPRLLAALGVGATLALAFVLVAG